MALLTLRSGSFKSPNMIACVEPLCWQRRWEKRDQQEGLEGLEDRRSPGRPRSVPETCDVLLGKWFAQGVSNVEMSRRLTVSEATIHRALARLGLHRRAAVSPELPWPDDSDSTGVSIDDQNGDPNVAPCEPSDKVASTAERDDLETLEDSVDSVDAVRGESVSEESASEILTSLAASGWTLDRDPDDRSVDRTLARLGQLDDAMALFGNRPSLRRAGVLLAVPLLVGSGLLEAFSKTYHCLGPAFYGVRTTVVVLFLGALLRIKRPEHFKEINPFELGHVMGLDRVPEVKTVRRKLTELANRKRARELMHALASHRIDEDQERVAFLYVDGHVREYHGQQPLAKGKKSGQVARSAATDNWVHDSHGEPLLVVTSEMNEGLTQVLEPIVKEVKELLGDRGATVIFDRGGYSPKLFARLVDLGFEVMTYRKGKVCRQNWERLSPTPRVAHRERCVGSRSLTPSCERSWPKRSKRYVGWRRNCKTCRSEFRRTT